MSVRTVAQAVVNAGKNSLAWTLALVHNQAATLGNEMSTNYGTNRTSALTLVALSNEMRTNYATNKTLIDNLRLFLLADIYSAIVAARGTTATKAKTTNTAQYSVNGALLIKAATDDLWTFGGAGSTTTVAISSFQKYNLLLDAAGTASVLEGTQSLVSAAAVVLPTIPAVNTKCIIATLTIATDGSHTFIPGTTALNAAGITATFQDGFDPGYLTAGAAALATGAASAWAAALGSAAVDTITFRETGTPS